MKHPMQPIEMVDGVVRFTQNGIVRWLVDHATIDLNEIFLRVEHGQFERGDYVQLMQLIGYSVSGFGDLGLDEQAVAEADAAAECLLEGKHMTNETLLLTIIASLTDPNGYCEECGDKEHHSNCPIGRLIDGNVWQAMVTIRCDRSDA